MAFSRHDLTALANFAAIARHGNFRRAGVELGVSASALSHSLKALEKRLEVRLLNRTNRSVTLTAAGEELLAEISGPFLRIENAAEVLNRYRGTPAGQIRLNVMDQALYLLGPVMPRFVDNFPDVEVEIKAANSFVDITEGRFDAGIRYGNTVPADLVARRLTGPIRWIMVAAPAYLDRFGAPSRPDDLADHRCIRFRIGDDTLYNWELGNGTEMTEVAVCGSVIVNDTPTALALVLAGVGILYGPEFIFAEHIQSGRLRTVLEESASMGPPMYVYYSSRRNVPGGLSALIDLVREMRPLGF